MSTHPCPCRLASLAVLRAQRAQWPTMWSTGAIASQHIPCNNAQVRCLRVPPWSWCVRPPKSYRHTQTNRSSST